MLDEEAWGLATPPLKPPLKWAGGKRWLVHYLRPLWNEHRHQRLVEPLCGGLAVTFSLMPDRALLNDVNPHLINFFEQLKRGLRITLMMRNESRLYYSYRDRFNGLIKGGKGNSREAAELFYYLNRTGYNGLCRFSRSGEFNVPFGRYKRINYGRDFRAYRLAMRTWEFTSKDFQTTPLDAADFVYADPPYDVQFTQYAKEGFSWDDQQRLAQWLSEHPGPVVLSNQATPRIVELYSGLGFSLRFLDAPRMISCNGSRTPAREVIATRGL